MNKDSKQTEPKQLTLYETYSQLADHVASTMGAQGRFVAISSDGSNTITKDGATVAKAFNKVQGMNVHESLCASFLMDASRSANKEGDGTSASIVLSSEMLKVLRESPSKVVQRTINLRKEVEEFTALIKNNTNKDKKNFRDVIEIAGHPQTNELVAEGLEFSENLSVVSGKVGEKSKLEKVEGSYIETSVNPDFINSFKLKEAGVILVDGDIKDASQVTKILEEALSKANVPNIAIFARGFTDEILAYLLEVNINSKNAFKVLPIVAPWIGTKKRASYYGDLSSITGAVPINSEDVESDFDAYNLGKSDITATPGSVLLTNSVGSPNKDSRLEAIEKELDSVDNARKRELLDRIDLFKGRSAILSVGADTLSDLTETYIRTKDGVSSGKSFLEGGAIRGGGVEIIYLLNKHKKDFPLLEKIVSSPLRTIMKNAKYSEEAIDKVIRECKKSTNKNAQLDLLKGELSEDIKNVWDATNVVTSSLMTAMSISTTVARVETVI